MRFGFLARGTEESKNNATYGDGVAVIEDKVFEFLEDS